MAYDPDTRYLGRMTHILLIDDHPLFCGGFTSTCAILRPHFRVSLAQTGGDALSRFRELSPVNCILIDILLPDASGFDMIQALARLDPLTPRVMISGRDDRAAHLRARYLGASGFISKADSPERIMSQIDLVLQGGMAFDDDSVDAEPVGADGLTPRQREVLELLAEGCVNKEIETRLGLAERTVRAHLTEIFKALGVANRARAVMEARRLGLVS